MRGLGVIQFLAVASVDVQIEGLIGPRGISPVEERFDFAMSALELHALTWLALACAIGIMLGRFERPLLLLFAALYWCLIELHGPFMSFQWDTLLIETSVLALPMATWVRADRWQHGFRAPPVLSAFAITWLNVKLVFSSGIVKLASGDPHWSTFDALQYHWWTQPQPGPLAWYAFQLPHGVQAFLCLGMFILELFAPIGILIPKTRRLSALALMSLQVAIFATGNYGFFNLLALWLCIPALDDELLAKLLRGSTPRVREARTSEATTVIAGVLIALSTIPFVGTIFGWNALPERLRDDYTTLTNTRAFNPYGLFATMTTERWEYLFEGTEDDVALGGSVTWHRYELPARPEHAHSSPPQVAPHLPRLDWSLWFAGLGASSYRPIVARTAERLREAEPSVLALFEVDPFEGRRPRRIRILRRHFRFSRASTTGDGSGSWVVESPR